MFYLNIDPMTIHIGHFMVRWYGIFIGLGIASEERIVSWN